MPTESGHSDFGALESDLGSGRSDRFLFYVFDILYLGAIDLRDRVIEVNLTSAWKCARAVLPGMAAKKGRAHYISQLNRELARLSDNSGRL